MRHWDSVSKFHITVNLVDLARLLLMARRRFKKSEVVPLIDFRHDMAKH